MMHKTLQLLACVVALTAPLAFTAPVFAAEPDDEMLQSDSADHQKFHEQWEQFRAEHKALMAERDHLMVRCMDAKGQDRTACDEQWQDLRSRHEVWRQRVTAFHEQAMAGNQHNHQGKHAHMGHKGGHNEHHEADGGHKHHHHHHHGMKNGANEAPAAPQSAPVPADQ